MQYTQTWNEVRFKDHTLPGRVLQWETMDRLLDLLQYKAKLFPPQYSVMCERWEEFHLW